MMAHKKLERAVQEAIAKVRAYNGPQGVWMTKNNRFMCWPNDTVPAAPGHLLVAWVEATLTRIDPQTIRRGVCVEYKI